ncbi:TPA: sugar kinase, partial [Candidatus Bathyarchaeota archaeon]|nr:sugar kinase [Candidatus Bathyarchaeota archaeon]
MSPDVICLGELLVEIMRKERGIPHDVPADYSGPYPSGAPAIFIDTVARLRVGSGFIGVVGDDDFGRMLVRRLREDGVDTTYIRVARGYTTGTTFVMYFRDGSRSFIFHLRHAAAGQLGPDDVDPGY